MADGLGAGEVGLAEDAQGEAGAQEGGHFEWLIGRLEVGKVRCW